MKKRRRQKLCSCRKMLKRFCRLRKFGAVRSNSLFHSVHTATLQDGRIMAVRRDRFFETKIAELNAGGIFRRGYALKSMARKHPKGEIHFISNLHIAEHIGDVWRVYEDDSTYSDSAGKKIILGNPQKDGNGSIIRFASVADADEWVKAGKIIHPSVPRAI